MSGLRLRKYVQCNWYDLVNIMNRQVCLVSQWSFNCPIELRYYDNDISALDDYRKILTKEEVERVRITCFVNYDRLLCGEKRNIKGDVFHVDKSETDSDEFLMWTHYSNAHKGVCLELQIQDSEFDDGWLNIVGDDTVFDEKTSFCKMSVIYMAWLKILKVCSQLD